MPLATVHLVALAPGAKVTDYAKAISTSVKPYVISRVQRWIIKPEKLSVSKLLDTKWDLMIIVPATEKIIEELLSPKWLSAHWSITTGVPSSLTKDFDQRNQKFLHPNKSDIPPLTGSTTKPKLASSNQALELSPELLSWSKSFPLGAGAMSMLNLLAFLPGPEAHASYLRYGKAFSESIGSKRGGNAKLVGKVVGNYGTRDEDVSGWDEFALAHYPSIAHFVDMLGSEDYQAVNKRERLPSLRDTCILCTSELDGELDFGRAKL